MLFAETSDQVYSTACHSPCSLFDFGVASDTKPVFVWLLMTDIGLLCMIPIAILGIQGTAEWLPFGLCLLQLVFARGTKAFAACRSKFPRNSTDQSSESTGEIGETEIGEIYGREVM